MIFQWYFNGILMKQTNWTTPNQSWEATEVAGCLDVKLLGCCEEFLSTVSVQVAYASRFREQDPCWMKVCRT